MGRARELADQLLTITKEAEGEYKKLTKAVSQYDMMQDDLLHKIELENFNACDGYKLAAQLKQIRQLRRDVKQDMSILTSIHANLKGSAKNISDTVKRVSQEFRAEYNKDYKPKILKY